MHVRHIIWYAIILFIAIIIIGIMGFNLLFNLTFLDSLYQSLLILGGLSLEIKPVSDTQKIFLGLFAFISIACYLIIVGIIIAALLIPIIEQALIDQFSESPSKTNI